MKVCVGEYKFLVFLILFSNSLGVSGQERTTSCDGVQDLLNSLKNSISTSMEKLKKEVDEAAEYYVRCNILALEEEVKQLKADNQKLVPLTERVQQLEAETPKIQTLTEDVQQLRTNDQKVLGKMEEVEGTMHRNVTAITDEVRELKAEDQKIIGKMEEVEGTMHHNVTAITDEVHELKAEDQKIIGKMEEFEGNMRRNISAITEEFQGLEAENQIILENHRNMKAKLRTLWEPVEKTFINETVTSPKARLYSGANFTGNFEDYTFETASFIGGCHKLKKLGNNVKSVDTFGKCVRLFDYGGCEGESVAVYPGSGNAENVLNPNLKQVGSIGPCLPEEFEDFDFKDATIQIIVKNSSNPRKYFPDSVQFLSVEKYKKANSVSGSSFSLDRYLLGPNNRSEFLRAFIYPKHLNISQSEFEVDMENTSDCTSYDEESGDVVGYGIPPSLGGPVNETYNVFPQTISGKSKWTALTSEIRPFLEGGGSRVELGLNFAYQDTAKNRPTGFYFWIWYVRESPLSQSQISYGRVEN